MSRVLTIPKGLTKQGELVVIPRVEYEEFLSLKKVIPLARLSQIEKARVEEGREQIRKGGSNKLKRTEK